MCAENGLFLLVIGNLVHCHICKGTLTKKGQTAFARNQFTALPKQRGVFGVNTSCSTLRKLHFNFLSNLMGYDRGVSFPFDVEPNGIPFGSKSKGKLSPRSYPIQFEWKYSFLSALGPYWNLRGVRNIGWRLIFCKEKAGKKKFWKGWKLWLKNNFIIHVLFTDPVFIMVGFKIWANWLKYFIFFIVCPGIIFVFFSYKELQYFFCRENL